MYNKQRERNSGRVPLLGRKGSDAFRFRGVTIFSARSRSSPAARFFSFFSLHGVGHSFSGYGQNNGAFRSFSYGRLLDDAGIGTVSRKSARNDLSLGADDGAPAPPCRSNVSTLRTVPEAAAAPALGFIL